MLSLIEKPMIRLVEWVRLQTNRGGRPGGKGAGKNTLLLGQAGNLYQPKRKEDVFLSTQDRLRHTYILGATGAGKTRLVEFLIRQDIVSGEGWALADAHGDLSQNIIRFLASLLLRGDVQQVAKYIAKKLVIIDPSNPKWTVGFNPLEARGIDPYMQALEFMGIFKKLWADAYWGPRMEELLRNMLITLSICGLTLLEARALLSDAPFRDQLITQLPQGEVKEYWLYRYGALSERMQATYREPILNRLSIFLSNPSVRSMVGQTKSTIDFRQILDQGQWLLLNLSKGKLKDSAYLLGALAIAKLQLAALSRVDLPEQRRRPFFAYIDEFQNFATHDLENILSEARKYGLGLILAHQNLDQLDRQLRAAILGNTASQIFFRLSNHDAMTLAAELSQKEKPILQRRLIDLKGREAFVKKKGQRPRLMKTVFVPDPVVTSRATEIVTNLTLSCHGRPRREVEEEIAKRTAELISGRNQVFPKNDSYSGRFAPHGQFKEAHEW